MQVSQSSAAVYRSFPALRLHFQCSIFKRSFIFSTLMMSQHKKPNKLINEKSPYLRQHCYNPVNWYPWSDEAFNKAKELNFPIFLSVGYSTCHWCHVMERESFENEAIADQLNKNFVSIKVDREERPDVDKLYMSFVQAVTGGGGWPMSVFLTPNLEPLTGGTYFPPHDEHGRMGFSSILSLIAKQWREKNVDLVQQGKAFAEVIRERFKQLGSKNLPATSVAIESCYAHLAAQFDEEHGGFGIAPKFPKPVDQLFLLYYYRHNSASEHGQNALRMVGKTLEKMAHGGIRDHVGKGFHRYSVDEAWHVPHFEKMLYDEGQLLELYANFYKITGKQLDVVLDIAEYLNKNLSHSEGGFFCAEDADSLPSADKTKKREGAFCVWTKAEVEEVLGDRPARFNENLTLDEIFCTAFNVLESGNVAPNVDVHNELNGKNVLKLLEPKALQKYADECGMSLDELCASLEDAKKFLAERRATRPAPHLDRKILTSWNGLAISGFCAAATVADKRSTSSDVSGGANGAFDHRNALMSSADRARALRERAAKALEFVRKYLVDSTSGELLRSVYADEQNNVVQVLSPIKAFSDDYAFLIQALLDMYEVDFNEGRLQWAIELQTAMDKYFWDKENDSGYFLSRADDPTIFARIHEDQDGAEPCTNSVAFSNLVRLAAIFDSKEYIQQAENILRGASQRLEKYAYILSRMVSALYLYDNIASEIVVIGRKEDELTQQMISEIQSKFLPHKYLIFLDVDKKNESFLVKRNEHFACLALSGEQATVYFCKNTACEMPLNTLEGLRERLGRM